MKRLLSATELVAAFFLLAIALLTAGNVLQALDDLRKEVPPRHAT